MIVYVVTEGGYEDYRIEALFSDRSDALKHIKKLAQIRQYHPEDQYAPRIEEWPLYEPTTKEEQWKSSPPKPASPPTKSTNGTQGS